MGNELDDIGDVSRMNRQRKGDVTRNSPFLFRSWQYEEWFCRLLEVLISCCL